MITHPLIDNDRQMNGSLFNSFIVNNFYITCILLFINILLLAILIGMSYDYEFSLCVTLKKCISILFNVTNVKMMMDFKLSKKLIFLLFLTVILMRFFQEMVSNSIQLTQVNFDIYFFNQKSGS